ncbi:MAG: lytic transglycosylase domain-containing protein [bacterium]|nr:lytic transglycosylase domain-containing protein [bacterium]
MVNRRRSSNKRSSGLHIRAVSLAITLAGAVTNLGASASNVDPVAALITASSTAKTKTPAPRKSNQTKKKKVTASKKKAAATKDSKNKVKPAAVKVTAAKQKKAAPLPPAPTRNPLRGLASKPSAPHQATTSSNTPPPPTRNALITDRVKALAPLLHRAVSLHDIKLLRQSMDHSLRSRSMEAKAVWARISDPVVRKLALWYHLRKASGIANPMIQHRFSRKNRDWPSGRLLRARAERALLETGASPKSVQALYRKNAPKSGVGKYLLARAYKRSSQPQKALKLARAVWHGHAIGEKIEKDLFKEFGDKLTNADHRRRADHFLYKDKRRYLSTIRRVRKLLPKGEQDKINLRMEVIKRRLNAADKDYIKMGSKALKDAGLLFNRIQLLRRKEKFDLSRKLLHKAPIDAKGMVEPNEWWIERRLQTRYALRHNKPLEAYKIASRHGDISRKNLCDAEFLAGWIALTRLNKIKAAARHFAAERKNARSRTEIAKAEYWLGRLRLKQKDSIGALAHFAASARYFRTYYGQLSLQSIEHKGRIGNIKSPAPSRWDLKRFLARDSVRALIIVHKMRLDGLTPLFFNHLAWHLKSPGEMTLLAELASQIHSRRGSVITGKVGVYRGFTLDRYAYPVNALPSFDQLTAKVDTALVLALARQESEFNAKAKSPVGARGMMQIMPGTARAIARQHKVRYSRSRLINDPSYNIALGVAHLHDLIKKYNGSYILPLVAYNAGPGRVTDWIESFGDPRAPNVNTVNWIESIPFTETRRYVQRIMSSVQIFRSRMDQNKRQIKLVQDINRGHPNAPAKNQRPPVVKINFTAQ